MTTSNPQGYPPISFESSSQRPRAPKVVAIIGIIFAGIAILNHTVGLILVFNNAVVPGMPPIATHWPVIDSSVSLVLALVLIVASINTLRWARSGRRMMIGWAVLHLSWLMIHGIVYISMVMPEMLKVQLAASGQQGSQAESVAKAAAVIVAILTLAIIAAFPIVVLIVMRRADVKAAFEGQPGS